MAGFLYPGRSVLGCTDADFATEVVLMALSKTYKIKLFNCLKIERTPLPLET